jgi:hypothetical protein
VLLARTNCNTHTFSIYCTVYCISDLGKTQERKKSKSFAPLQLMKGCQQNRREAPFRVIRAWDVKSGAGGVDVKALKMLKLEKRG